MYRFKQRVRKSQSNLLNWLQRCLGGYYSRRRRKYANERGIALPLVIGVGLIMLLLAITVIARSQSSQVNSSSLKQVVQASEVAETGVTQVQSLFNQYRQLPFITLANFSSTTTTWTQASLLSPPSCTPSTLDPVLVSLLSSIFKKDTTTPAWVNIDSPTTRRFRVIAYDYIPTSIVNTNATVGAFTIPASNASTNVTVTPSTYLASGKSVYGQIAGVTGILTNTSGTYTFAASIAPTSTIAIPNTSPQNIFYPISYGGANIDSGVGKLWVEGQTLSNGNVISTSGLQVGIPVIPGDVRTIPIPGTWLGANLNGPNNGNIFQTNALVGCNINPNGMVVPSPYVKNQTATQLPSVPTPPVGTVNLGNVSVNNNIYNLPKTSGYNASNGTYEYIINNISGNGAIYVNPNYKVTIYLQSNIDKLTDIVYTNDPTVYPAGYPPYNVGTPTTTVTFSSSFTIPVNGAGKTVNPTNNSYLNDGQSVYGMLDNGTPGILSRSGTTYTFTPNDPPNNSPSPYNGAITVAANSTFSPTISFKSPNFKIFGNGPVGSSICIKGSRNLNAFILAPNYTVGITGGSAIVGAVWAGAWGTNLDGSNSQCGSVNSNVVVLQNANWDDITGVSPVNLPPTVQPIQTWNKKEGT